jgi:predicted permease
LQQEPLLRGSGSLLHQTIPAWLRVIGRLKPGATIAGMPARLTVVIRRYLKDESDYPAAFMPEIIRLLPKQHVNVVPAGSGVGTMKESYRSSLRILLTVCGLVLLIACANVANLLLARGVAQRANISIRTALGASRTCLMRQMLTESILLAVLGGIAGLVVAYFGARLLLVLAFHSARFIPISADPALPVLGFALALSLITGVLFGTAPAWLASRTDPAEALRGLNRSSGERSSLPQKTLLVMQAALSIVLLAGAGLLTRSVANLEHQDFGFATDHRISVAINDPPTSLSEDQLRVVYKRLRERLLEIPGVRSVGLAQYSPLTDNWSDMVYPEGSTNEKLDMNQSTSCDRVGVGYLETLDHRILQGRTITEEDNEHSRPVAVVNQTFAKRFFPGKNPIGMHFGMDLLKYSKTYEIVGVVRDAKYTDPEHAVRPMFFMPLAQHVNYDEDILRSMELRSHYMSAAVLSVDPNAGNMTAQIRKTFADVNPDLTILDINPLRKQVNLAFDQQRAVAQLVALFGLVALLLAAVGLYGVTAYTVARRTSEIGIRMALGADRKSVVRLVLHGAFTQVAIGLAIGIPAAIAAGRLIASQLYQVKFWDPTALLLSIVTLSVCALIASVIPARRAASIDPMKALRTE